MTASVTLDLPDLAATRALAARLARLLRAGDVVALSGPLGVGKTTFARAVVAALARRTGAAFDGEVPSPTFTLVQGYDFPGLSVQHIDCYRIEDPAEAWELGIEEAFVDAVCLIEWPERIAPLLPPDRLALGFGFRAGGGEARRVDIAGHGAWASRAEALADGR